MNTFYISPINAFKTVVQWKTSISYLLYITPVRDLRAVGSECLLLPSSPNSMVRK